MHIKEGSIWKKWDLHLHAPFTQLNDGYKAPSGIDVLDKFCEELENSDVGVFGITDYFSINAYNLFIAAFAKKYPASEKQFFFNLELRLNESVNKKLEEVNIHLIFNPNSIPSVPKFLSKLKIIRTGKDAAPITCNELTEKSDFEAATVTRDSIRNAFDETFGKDAIRQKHFLIFTAANNDGIRPESGKKRKNEITDEIDKLSDGFIGSSSNVQWYLKVDRLEEEGIKISSKPVITGSDAHSFEDVTNYLGKNVNTEKEVDGKKQVVRKEITWIKADPTYEGFKQIIYEPQPGERVLISPVKPDQKDEFKVIKKIKFGSSLDFPDEIVFNGNLCSIIGSRSSGKSALLAYIAYAVDAADTKSKIKGPGEGEAFHWEKLGHLQYTVEWANGKSTIESKGKVIYLPQNYLFDKSKEAKEVKNKIAPVLFKTNPSFKTTYDSANAKIAKLNVDIDEYVSKWFKTANDIDGIETNLKDLGDKKSISTEKEGLEKRIEELKTKNNFSDNDVQQYQSVTDDLNGKNARIAEIAEEQQQLTLPQGKVEIFRSISFSTAFDALSIPKKLQDKIDGRLNGESQNLLVEINKIANEYLVELDNEKSETEAAILDINTTHAELIARYRQNEELQKLITDLNRQKNSLTKIEGFEAKKVSSQELLTFYEAEVTKNMAERLKTISELKTFMDSSTEKTANGIEFGIEYGFENSDIEKLAAKVNMRDRSDYIDGNGINVETIRDNVAKFISDVCFKNQKIIQGHNPIDVVKTAFQLTEKILFTADMEGDKIGGFKEPTMTAGKRALFALRLILAESDDKWPLLIDQPEDDLDSRSIYDEIVPFLKQKKKERQIIMVSHNANLVIGADSEQLIIANRNGSDRKNADGKQFNYLCGSLEFTQELDEKCLDTLKAQGVCEHACAILDGGRAAFETRKNKYNFK